MKYAQKERTKDSRQEQVIHSSELNRCFTIRQGADWLKGTKES